MPAGCSQGCSEAIQEDPRRAPGPLARDTDSDSSASTLRGRISFLIWICRISQPFELVPDSVQRAQSGQLHPRVHGSIALRALAALGSVAAGTRRKGTGRTHSPHGRCWGHTEVVELTCNGSVIQPS